MIHQLYYSDKTHSVYANLFAAQRAEGLYEDKMDKFNKIRQDYIEEDKKLKTKYAKEFKEILEGVEAIMNQNNFNDSTISNEEPNSQDKPKTWTVVTGSKKE